MDSGEDVSLEVSYTAPSKTLRRDFLSRFDVSYRVTLRDISLVTFVTRYDHNPLLVHPPSSFHPLQKLLGGEYYYSKASG